MYKGDNPKIFNFGFWQICLLSPVNLLFFFFYFDVIVDITKTHLFKYIENFTTKR